MDWTLDEWHARRFWRAMRGGYGRGVEGVLMGEAREAEREVEEAWMAEEGEYEWREEEEGDGDRNEDEEWDGASEGEEPRLEGGTVDGIEEEEMVEEGVLAEGEVEDVDMVGGEAKCEMVEVLDGVGGDGFEFVERWEAEDELEGEIIKIPGIEMADMLEEGVLVEMPPEAERYPARPGLFTLCWR